MSQSLHPEARRFGPRSTLQLIVSILLAVTPASANGTFDFDPCSEPDIRELHIDRTMQLSSVTRDGQAINLAEAPLLVWNDTQTDPASYELGAPAVEVVPSLALRRQGRHLAFFAIVPDTTEPTP